MINESKILNVDLIYMKGLNDPNGLSSLVRKISEAHEDFVKYGVEQRIISAACLNHDDGNNNQITKDIPSLFKKIIRTVSRYSCILTFFRLYRALLKPAKEIIDYYDTVENKGSVVVFHEIYSCYEYLKRNRDNKQKVVLTIHSNGELWKMLFTEMPRLKSVLFRPYRKRVEDTLLRSCDYIGFDADMPRKVFCELFHFDESKTFFAYNGIEERPYPFREKGDTLKIICVATLNSRKNQIGILNAISYLQKEDKEKIELVLVGDGSSRKELEDKAKEESLNVVFKGTASEKEYYNYLLNANCFCLFSKDEGLPIAVIEGMRAGLPILGSRVAGIPEEIIDGVTGFLVDVDDKELSEKIKYFVDNLELLGKMGKASYEYFLEKFTTSAMARKYSQIYKG